MQMNALIEFVLDLACTMVNRLTAVDPSQLRRVAATKEPSPSRKLSVR